jgi:protoheme IX farnesyltransferase
VLLFVIIFLWTPPHFWALALLRADDYARAGVPMLPVVAGTEETRRHILLYSVALVAAGAAPWLLGYFGTAYGVTTLLGGAAFVALAWRVRRGMQAERAPQQLFGFSILYLFVLFAAVLIEGVGGGGLPGRLP